MLRRNFLQAGCALLGSIFQLGQFKFLRRDQQPAVSIAAFEVPIWPASENLAEPEELRRLACNLALDICSAPVSLSCKLARMRQVRQENPLLYGELVKAWLKYSQMQLERVDFAVNTVTTEDRSHSWRQLLYRTQIDGHTVYITGAVKVTLVLADDSCRTYWIDSTAVRSRYHKDLATTIFPDLSRFGSAAGEQFFTS